MTSIIRVGAAVNAVKPCDSKACMESLWRTVQEQEAESPDILLFPPLALCGVSCGSFFGSDALLEDCRAALEQLCILSAQRKGYLVVGLSVEDLGCGTAAMAVLCNGKVQGILPALDAPPALAQQQFSGNMLQQGTVFGCGKLRFAVLCCNIENLPRYMHYVADSGCDLVLVASAQAATAGSAARGAAVAQAVSRDWGIAVAVANAGMGEASAPVIYRGWCGVWECGSRLAYAFSDQDGTAAVADLDSDIIRALKKSRGGRAALCDAYVSSKQSLRRPVEREPFLAGMGELELLELFDLQARSLATRMQNTGIQRLVLGVSGGLDSTLALLVAVRALELAGLPIGNLLGITMPGFGTTGRTHGNAVALVEAVGAVLREIPIADACRGHYSDIGLDERERSVAYENAQARERTQILLDIANMQNALVVGTGDMSEAALGWCTFGGDHLASYGVNGCLTKGLVRRVCAAVAAMPGQPRGVAQLLQDVLDTPISPELLPPAAGGEIAQRTEDILGPYELHDFFLYYLICYRMRPLKIYHYACIAFGSSYRADYIKDRLVFFVRRFFASQFKRSCQTEGAAILYPNLTPCGFTFPADICADGLLEELLRE